MTNADKKKIKLLTMAGVTAEEIGRRLFYHKNTILYQRRKMNLLNAKDYCDGRVD